MSSSVINAPPRITPGRILELSWGLARTATLVTALDLDVFSHVAAGHDTVDRLITATGGSQRGIEALLTGLAATGLVTVGGDDRYRLAPDAATFLVRGIPSYLGDMRHVHHELNYRIWPKLTEAVTTGEPVREIFAEDGSGTWEKITPYLDALATAAANALVRVLRDRLRHPPRVMDVGCGSGGYDRVLATEWSGTSVVGVDRPDVTAIATRLAEQAGCSDSISYRSGDLREIDWGGSYNVVLMSNVLHGYPAQDCLALLARARQALAPDGLLAIYEIIPDHANPTTNPVAAFFGLQMVMTSEGATHGLEDYRGWLVDTGFTPPQVLHGQAGPLSLLVSTVAIVEES